MNGSHRKTGATFFHIIDTMLFFVVAMPAAWDDDFLA